MTEELDVSTADMLEIVAGGGNGVEYVDIPGLLERAAKELRTVIRERDEARAAVTTANFVVAEYQSDLIEAEQRGYRKGVEDAAGLMEKHGFGGSAAAILALLEQKGD